MQAEHISELVWLLLRRRLPSLIQSAKVSIFPQPCIIFHIFLFYVSFKNMLTSYKKNLYSQAFNNAKPTYF